MNSLVKMGNFVKKLILAFIALAFAFAISSCCDQSYCPGNMKCPDKYNNNNNNDVEERPYRWDTQERVQPGQERQHRRW
ncbi:MAG: hypothetical protein ACD_17C00224G0001 [uncultured bacterium]|nr:MAG: hypothetical protein ACD_17C00224G0001 [uncultured bacterium]OGN56887.1 MAG: hypothetical protein A2796_06880 [Chlamydiae bacterium RIFCSPHIGHO2_01_FULL_44_39]OGN56992.1 MAG: hypothetical protein A3C42_03800 [Chlamydiae bacterium RIFCSPHIGHO2_02_FULL_45_9]OGN59545.1 MAG: hypothetical protein A3D96_07570 [Chlamydiae bacterium RIFCSPHIGHO2_12_FULL_44_59]OGN67290.1 MAG: hypothetical protein A2978_03400 [Chlamydiae bacterium RIFCSPLOWO2_01_FULL_44_52]OGN68711.1 MAG: hypothetical protein A3